VAGGLPSEVQHLWKEGGELETYRFLFRQEGVADEGLGHIIAILVPLKSTAARGDVLSCYPSGCVASEE
jgi:hypothetical protein